MTSQQHCQEAVETSVDEALLMDTTEKQRMENLGWKVINLEWERMA